MNKKKILLIATIIIFFAMISTYICANEYGNNYGAELKLDFNKNIQLKQGETTRIGYFSRKYYGTKWNCTL